MHKRIVTLEYEIRIAGGELLESSAQRGPLRFVSGTGQLLPALEQRIDKLSADQEESGVLKAAEAFGDVSQLPIKMIPRSEFPGSDQLELGRVFEARTATRFVSPSSKPRRTPCRFAICTRCTTRTSPTASRSSRSKTPAVPQPSRPRR